MSEELDYLSQQVAIGRTSRRHFLGRAAALGLSATAANALLANAARAAGPRRGGTLRIGLQGGSASDSLDPALAASAMTSHVGRSWGEQLVRQTPDGYPGNPAGNRVAFIAGCQSVGVQDSQGCAIPQRQGAHARRRSRDDGAPLWRELQIRRAGHHARD